MARYDGRRWFLLAYLMPIRSALLLGALCLTGYCSPDAQAQEILNTLWPRAAAQVEQTAIPDTTPPWHYFPLAIGNVWEYQDAEGYVTRMTTVRDTSFDGHRYFRLDYRSYEPAPVFAERTYIPFYVRYDTTEQRARENHPNAEDEVVYFSAPCPFDASFNAVADCAPVSSWYVGGGYDGVLIFGGERPGEGSDTLRTPVKTFVLHGIEYRYAANFGLVYWEVEGHGAGLVYAKIDGVEYGKHRITVSREPDAFVASKLRIERAYPNPLHTQLHLDYIAVQTGPLTMSVFDVLGRRVATRHVPGGTSGTALLDVSVLAPGAYFARLCDLSACVSQPVVKAF